MLNKDTERALETAEGFLKRLEQVNKFSAKYQLTPSGESAKLAESMRTLADGLPQIDAPQNEDQLLQSELKRRLNGESAYLIQQLSGGLYDFDAVIKMLGIPKQDISSLRSWLEQNKERTHEAIERLFHARDIEGYELPISRDIPSVRRQVEEFAGVHIQRYHKTLGKFLQGLTKVGEYLRDVNAVPTTNGRSYFNPRNNNLALDIGDICFSKEDGTLHVREKELIRLYGHEGMGHALNFAVTRQRSLPYFLTQDSALTVATAESVAQFYEGVLMKDLRNSPETQRQLGIEHKFANIYQETIDTEQLEAYKRKMFQYGIIVLADKSLGNPNDPEVLKKKTEILHEIAIDKSSVAGWVQKCRYESFDSEGNLSPSLVAELRYCAQPVDRALEEFRKRGINYDERGRNTIDATFLSGLWTPMGFVDNARLRAGSQ